MSAAEHDAVHRDLGVYVLGGLDPAERDRVERHLVDCSSCRDELASLAALPPLLTRASSEAETAPAPPSLGPVIERVVRDQRAARRRNRSFAAVAVLAVAVAVAAVVRPPAGVPEGDRYIAATGGVTAVVEARDWGMAVHITAEALPPADGYTAVAVTGDGHRTQVASWAATDGPAAVDGACYLTPSRVDRMEIVTARDEAVVAVLRPATP